jgi:hypothetical protein
MYVVILIVAFVDFLPLYIIFLTRIAFVNFVFTITQHSLMASHRKAGISLSGTELPPIHTDPFLLRPTSKLLSKTSCRNKTKKEMSSVLKQLYLKSKL